MFIRCILPIMILGLFYASCIGPEGELKIPEVSLNDDGSIVIDATNLEGPSIISPETAEKIMEAGKDGITLLEQALYGGGGAGSLALLLAIYKLIRSRIKKKKNGENA